IDPDIKSEQTQTLVFLAHYDSISHALFDVLESIGYLAALLGGVIFSIHSLIYLIPVILFTSSPDPMGQLIWGLPFALLTFIELFNSKGNKSQGVIDNGSGLAQIYHLALVLSENKLKNTRVVLVATGAEEQGDYGAYYFVQKYKSKYPPETTKYIISDSIGVEKNLIVYGIGLPKKHWSPSLEKTAREIASEDEYPLKFIAIPPLLAIATDHVAVVPEKYEFLLFASMTSAIHTNKDTFEALDEKKYRQMLQFIENFVRKIDEQETKTLQ
ncbi:MAG: M28 family peptidase, partial [archaeon]|nr:M28 family peptidase [archaeon]